MPPALLRVGPYRFYMVSADGDERPHVHIERDNQRAKFFIDRVEFFDNEGFRQAEVRRIQRLVTEHQEELLERWYGYFGGPRR